MNLENTQVQSMTGFGRGEATNDNFRIVVEIKSVNHRYKDFRFRMPSIFNKQEMQFKSLIGKAFNRGSFDISLNIKSSNADSGVRDIDYSKVNNFLNGFKSETGLSDASCAVRPTDFLRNEFYFDLEDRESALLELGMKAFEDAISKIEESRLEEGKKLSKIVETHINRYEGKFQELCDEAKKINDVVKTRLQERFQEFKEEISVDEPRFMQEVLFYLEKLDVNEEMNRIKAHLERFESLFKSKKELGREVEFVLQELNRETNTIGSKSTLSEVSKRVVDMKVELEKIREQGLNLQ
ncbi:MAG: YicC/YloC family endoribonuclease [Bacteriovoracaceae bacterium]